MLGKIFSTRLGDFFAHLLALATTRTTNNGKKYRLIGSAGLVGLGLILVVAFQNCSKFQFSGQMQVSLDTDLFITKTDTFTFEGDCVADKDISVSNTDNGVISCVQGRFTYTTKPQTTDGKRVYRFSQQIDENQRYWDLTWIRDTVPPIIKEVIVNDGDDYTGLPFVQTRVDAIDNIPESRVVKIQVNEAYVDVNYSCQQGYQSDGWSLYKGFKEGYDVFVSTMDGEKKVCAWAEDVAGNISVIENEVVHENHDTINFEVGNIPRFTQFDVLNNNNQKTRTFQKDEIVRVSWTLEDVEGLAVHPVDIFIKTETADWQPLVEDLGNLPNKDKIYQDEYTFHAPTDGFFRLKIIGLDKASNTSIAILSDSFNTLSVKGDWEVYAGSPDRGVGLSAKSVSLYNGTNLPQKFVAHPKTLEIFLIDEYGSVVRINPRTGRSSHFIKQGALNLPEDGPLPDNITANTGGMMLAIDNKGLLYIGLYGDRSADGQPKFRHYQVVYQIDLEKKWVRKYLGATQVLSNPLVPDRVHMAAGSFAFDEDNSLYFLSSCDPEVWLPDVSTWRMLKVTQTPDGRADTVNVIAGNCKLGEPIEGEVALKSPLSNHVYTYLSSIAVWNRGASIYFSHLGVSKIYKILNGKIYHTSNQAIFGQASLPTHTGFIYNPYDKKLYVNAGAIYKVTPNLTGSGGDTGEIFVANNGSGSNCSSDGVLSNEACVDTSNVSGLALISRGIVLFGDGVYLNAQRMYRVRYRDQQNLVKTLAGTFPFYGDGLPKSVIRGKFSGIYYKKASEPNQSIFPAGLYFVEPHGLVLGHINNSGMTAIAGGNQRLTVPQSGRVFGRDLSLGYAYSGGNMMPLTFKDGLPWLRVQHNLLSVDSNKQWRYVTNGTTDNSWQHAVEGSKASGVSLWVDGGGSNFTFKGQGLFLLGAYYDELQWSNDRAVFKFFDFASAVDKVVTIMNADVRGNSLTPDGQYTRSQLQIEELSGLCNRNRGTCMTAYREESGKDRLYFSEGKNLRVLTNPLSQSITLKTIFTHPTQNVYNFIFHPQQAGTLFVLIGGNASTCYLYKCSLNLTTDVMTCDNAPLGPPQGLQTIGSGPNQFSWYDTSGTKLFMSNYKGEILVYTLP